MSGRVLALLSVLTVVAVASQNQPSLFEDLPLEGFELSRPAQGEQFLLAELSPDVDSLLCVKSSGINQLLAHDTCDALDGRLWAYESKSGQLQLAHDASLCLDVFRFSSGSSLGLYWCHGE